MVRLIIFSAFFLFTCSLKAQDNWQFKKEEEGIKVYTADVKGSHLKKVKVTCTLNATLSQLAALLMDAPAHEQWVYNTKQSYMVRQADAWHQVYYSETTLPWPFANRDVVVDMELIQDKTTRMMRVISGASKVPVPLKKGVIRVDATKVEWFVKPISDRLLDVVYIAQADPGGSVPAWIVNAFVTKGPMESFLSLRKLLGTQESQQSQYVFIQD